MLGWAVADIVVPTLRAHARGPAHRPAQERRQRAGARRRGRARSISARTSASDAVRPPPGARRSRRSCPTRSRPCSARSISTVAPTAAHAMVDRLVAPGFPTTIEGLDQLDNKTQLQELRRPRRARRTRLHGRPRPDPTTPRRSSPRCSSTARCSVRGPGGRRRPPNRSRRPRACAVVRLTTAERRRCLSCPRSRRSGAGSASTVVGRRIVRVEVGRERVVRRTSREALIARSHRRGRSTGRPARASTCCCRSTPATR